MDEPKDDFWDASEPGVFEHADPAALAASDARAIADADAGRTISHETMKRWLLSWGTDNPLPKPKCGE